MRRRATALVGLLVAALVAAGFALVTGLGYWAALGIVAGAMLVNGWVAMLEDALPGGFENPEGDETPRWAILAGRWIRALGVVLVVACVLALWFARSAPGGR
jgi:hypothetical protein